MASSRKFLAIILIYAAGAGLLALLFSGAFSRPLQLHDLLVALRGMAVGFVVITVGLFLRGKTAERILTISPQGISTQIGSLTGLVPWDKVRLIVGADQHVLIVGSTGNAFFIPARAFSGAEQKKHFIECITHWHALRRRGL